MPIRYTIHQALGVVVTRFKGHVTDEQFVELYDRLMNDDAYVLGMDELADLRGVEKLGLTVPALRQVEQLTEARYDGSDQAFRTAIIAPRDPSFGIARMYEVFAEGGPEHVHVFRESAAALRHLDLGPDDIDL